MSAKENQPVVRVYYHWRLPDARLFTEDAELAGIFADLPGWTVEPRFAGPLSAKDTTDTMVRALRAMHAAMRGGQEGE
jgi:hypothetical protein